MCKEKEGGEEEEEGDGMGRMRCSYIRDTLAGHLPQEHTLHLLYYLQLLTVNKVTIHAHTHTLIPSPTLLHPHTHTPTHNHTHLQVLVVGLHGDNVPVHAHHLPLQVHELTVTHLHHVPRGQHPRHTATRQARVYCRRG